MFLKPLKIGGVELHNNLMLAPMSGVTNSCFRRLIRKVNPGAVGLVVTEFISVEGMTRKNEQSLRMMHYVPEERPLSIQVFGNPIDRMVDAAIMIEQSGADIVDINCGCPVPKVVKKGGGCELMRQPEHLKNILTAVCKAVSIPVTIKIRSGWDEKSKNAKEIALIAQDCGVKMIAVHGRTRQALYRGNADWTIVEELAELLEIPVIGSGDIIDAQSAKQALKGHISGVMIGRGALSNPWIFSEIAAAAESRPYLTPPASATVDILEQYMGLLIDAGLPEKSVIGRMKQLGSQVTRRVKGSTEARRGLCLAKSLQEQRELLKRWRDYLCCREQKENLLKEAYRSEASIAA